MLRRALARVARAASTHAEPGSTRGPRPPDGYVRDTARVTLGSGHRTFARARELIRGFEMYPPEWTRIVRLDVELAPGAVFGTLASHFGFWSFHPCRIERVFADDEGDSGEVGFALVTLPGHGAAGEERFRATRARDGTVTFDIVADSRPAGWLARAARPLMRTQQRRFRATALARMRELCREAQRSPLS